MSGWNMPSLVPLLEKRVIRTIRETFEKDVKSLNDPVYHENIPGLFTNCIYPFSILFSPTGSVLDPPETAPSYETLH